MNALLVLKSEEKSRHNCDCSVYDSLRIISEEFKCALLAWAGGGEITAAVEK